MSYAIRLGLAVAIIYSSSALNLSGAQAAKIGDKVTHGSLHATVLKVKRTSELVSSNGRLTAKEGHSLLAITVRFENPGQTPATVTLPKGETTVQVRPSTSESTYYLSDMGVVFGDQSRFVVGSKGVMHLASPKDLWKLTGDFTNDVWSVTLSPGTSLDTLMVFTTTPDAADCVLKMPGFPPILLEI